LGGVGQHAGFVPALLSLASHRARAAEISKTSKSQQSSPICFVFDKGCYLSITTVSHRQSGALDSVVTPLAEYTTRAATRARFS
jgi:hypothetical protein